MVAIGDVVVVVSVAVMLSLVVLSLVLLWLVLSFLLWFLLFVAVVGVVDFGGGRGESRQPRRLVQRY